MYRPLSIAIVACALTLGCAGKAVSKFRPVSDVQQLAGTYENGPSAPGYGGTTLWKLLRPNHPKSQATPVDDQPTDRVSIEIGPGTVVNATLVRDGAVVDRQRVPFAWREDHLYRKSGGLVARPAFPLLWMTGGERVGVGLDPVDAEGDPLLVHSTATATGWLLILPFAAVGGGPGILFRFERPAPTAATRPAG